MLAVLCGCWEPISGHLQELQTLLTSDISSACVFWSFFFLISIQSIKYHNYIWSKIYFSRFFFLLISPTSLLSWPLPYKLSLSLTFLVRNLGHFDTPPHPIAPIFSYLSWSLPNEGWLWPYLHIYNSLHHEFPPSRKLPNGKGIFPNLHCPVYTTFIGSSWYILGGWITE